MIKKLLLIFALVFTVAVVAWQASRPTAPGSVTTDVQIVRVTIEPPSEPNGAPKVTPISVEITSLQQVEWRSSTGEEFVVAFPDRKPFKEHYFHNLKPKSGAVALKEKVTTRQEFKYSVLIRGVLLDPSVIIKPDSMIRQ